MEFINKTLDDLIKKAQVEVLLSSVLADKSGVTIYPVKCPAVGRKEDYLMDVNKKPSCILKGKYCKYFESAKFTLEDYEKIIVCNVVNIEDIKGQ